VTSARTRRSTAAIVSLLAAVLLLCTACAGTRAVATAPLAAHEAEAPARIVAGPMLGHTTHREATLWLQLDREAEVAIQWFDDTNGAQGRTAAQVASAQAFHTVTIPVTRLEPGHRYRYTIEMDGVASVPVHPQTFETQVLWQWRTDPPPVRIAIGSCMYVNEPAYDRPGRPYGGDYAILGSVLEADPDLMLWLGDNTYLREADWWSRDGIGYRYSYDRALPELQPLLAAAAHYATWDDHDFGPNNSDRTYPLRGAVRDIFELFWANPSYGQPDLPGVFTQFQWADVDVFLLDDRYHRSSNRAPVEARTILGEAQLAWLLDALSSSNAPFKLVAMGNQVLNPNTAYEGLVHAPAEYAALLDGIRERRIEGVVFVSGDRHHSELIRLEQEGGYPLYDITSSPLTAGAGDARYELDNPARVPGTLVVGQRSFGILEVTGAKDERVLEVRAHAVDGTVLWSHTIPASALTFPADGEE
jgi:alkaline phosphatase D